MRIDRLIHWPCKQANCFKPAVYEFTDVKNTIPNGSLESGEHKKTITLGHSCEHHVEEVNKMLKEIHNGN